ncbi:type I phosphomannose isomerase catalytic subunit [Treponema sp.]|uniref:type I phosphomannose isomerase catalytic subunit n=1 Tax=Treponema sp. TaxID=166 RepID=UPI003F042E84
MKKLNAIKSEKVWGYENWIASTHPNGFQKDFFELCGGDYPLLVKVIQADSTLSVQVHPDDEMASLYEHCRGKTECWYILSAEEGTELVYGLNGVYSASELRKAIEADSLQDCLRYEKVRAGDFLYIPAGTVHAICGGLRLLEVQQSSDVTYRLYDWGRGRECHVERGIACIKDTEIRKVLPFPGSFVSPYFSLEEVSVEGKHFSRLENCAAEKKAADIVLGFVIEGSGTINGIPAAAEDIFAFEPGDAVEIEGRLKLMKITAK